MYTACMNGAIEDANTEQEIYEAFNMFDEDGSKNITAKELKIVMRNLGTQVYGSSYYDTYFTGPVVPFTWAFHDDTRCRIETQTEEMINMLHAARRRRRQEMITI